MDTSSDAGQPNTLYAFADSIAVELTHDTTRAQLAALHAQSDATPAPASSPTALVVLTLGLLVFGLARVRTMRAQAS